MPHLIAAESAFPAHYHAQHELLGVMRALWHDEEPRRLLERFFHRVRVEGRHLALPLERYLEPRGQAARHADWLRVAQDLGARAGQDALAAADLDPQGVALVASSTVTGVAVPSLEARIADRLKLPRDVRRVPLFGLGCAGGAAGLARVADYLTAHPSHAALLIAVELCSLTLQVADLSMANLIGTGLFGDGAAAVVLVGDDHPLAARSQGRVVDSRSWLFPETERVMGWDVTDEGLQLVLRRDVPELARQGVPPVVQTLLAPHGIGVKDVASWIVHPGGPAVLDAVELGLELDAESLQLSRDSLARLGNLSSASVLSILGDALHKATRPAGAPCVVLAMGPGFAAEAVLMRW